MPQIVPNPTRPDLFHYTCAIKQPDNDCWKYDGNFIRYQLLDGEKTLKLVNINAEYCVPKPPGCHCNTMLSNLLPKLQKIDKIVGYFSANPFLAGCKCYLGSAAKANFKFLQMTKVLPNAPKECSRKISFDAKDYGKICEGLKKEAEKCWKDPEEPGGYGNGVITKT